MNTFSETSTVGADVCELCEHLSRFRRPILVVGGNADIWGFGIGWDVMVQNIALMARSLGIPTIDGVNYFAGLERPQQQWYSTKTEANHAVYLKLYEDARNVVYAITPHGSYGAPGALPRVHVVEETVVLPKGATRGGDKLLLHHTDAA